VSPLHLLEVGLSWPPEAYLQRRLEALAAKGMRVTVAAYADQQDRFPSLPGIRLVRLPNWDERRLYTITGVIRDGAALATKRPRKFVELFRCISKLHLFRAALPLLLADADVVHFEWESTARSFLPLFELLGAPIVVSSHGGIQIRPFIGDERMTSSYSLIFRKATAVHCVCNAVFQAAVGFGLDPSKAHIIRTAVDTEFFKPATRVQGRTFRVVAIGELSFIKGYDVAIEAISDLVSRGVPATLHLIGDTPSSISLKSSDRSRLMYLISDLKLRDRVHLVGWLTQEQVRDYLHQSDVLLQSSLSEGLPNAVLEAMACALPVVVTDCGGLREVVRDGIEGYLCPRRSSKKVADALYKLWENPEQARRMGEAGRLRVVSKFALSRQVDEFVRLYDSLRRMI
jgi:colanic acid/amylovoran biosynthesis glycosyltransferase